MVFKVVMITMIQQIKCGRDSSRELGCKRSGCGSPGYPQHLLCSRGVAQGVRGWDNGSVCASFSHHLLHSERCRKTSQSRGTNRQTDHNHLSCTVLDPWPVQYSRLHQKLELDSHKYEFCLCVQVHKSRYSQSKETTHTRLQQ